ncbi:MmgE/PrpD family protein [Methylobacterium sp. WSM2598]|uniref:MmgE/PrpD family protein n=1 Tax=Methylobacterium sp. WSM2598 TaxID=398261 RepID=UPI000369CD8C|nr:MmgE/PrpD family protein [Methylobacterium sp. WSM2598]
MSQTASGHGTDRRKFLQVTGSLLAAAASPVRVAAAGGEVTGQLARYMVEARDRPLPPEVVQACKHRILDTFGAMISGARMRPGELATAYVRGLGGTDQATVVASDLRTTAINAALANAMCAHADETDDFEPVTKAHPGSATVPAALAMAEKEGRSGLEMIRAVALGYDLCCRLLLALGPDLVRGSHRSAEGTSSTFGALGAAAILARLDERSTRFALSYAAQQVSGLWSWVKDEDHIEKAFDFAGMGARNGVTAVSMVQAGLTGVADVLDGTHNLFIALSSDPKPEAMLEGLGSRFFVTETAIKTFSVGYPIQSPLDAVLTLRERHGLRATDVRQVVVHLPTDAVGIVGHSAMPDVNCQHLVALALVKGAVSFADSHDPRLMQEPSIQSVREKVEVVGDPGLMTREAPRSARVEVILADGRRLEHFTKFPPGTKENPLSTERVNAKVRDLIVPVLGVSRADDLIARINDLENLEDVRALRQLFAP